MKPRIAIPADTLTEATNIINERNAAFAPRPLIEAVLKSGGLPVIFLGNYFVHSVSIFQNIINIIIV